MEFNLNEQVSMRILDEISILADRMTKVEKILRSKMLEDTMSAEEAAVLLNVTIKTLYKLTSKKEVPHFKRGKKLVFSRKELHKWMQRERIFTRTDYEEMAGVVMRNNSKRLKTEEV